MSDELEARLQRALSTYSNAEPLAGLEDRILQKVHASPKRRTGVWAALVLAACLAVALLVVAIGRPKATPPLPIQVTSQAAAPASSSIQTGHIRVAKYHRRPLRRPHLNQQEILLSRFVTADPVGAAKTFKSLNEATNRDLATPPLEIEPIEIKSLQ